MIWHICCRRVKIRLIDVGARRAIRFNEAQINNLPPPCVSCPRPIIAGHAAPMGAEDCGPTKLIAPRLGVAKNNDETWR